MCAESMLENPRYRARVTSYKGTIVAFDLSRFSKAWNDYWGAFTADVPFKHQMLELATEVSNLSENLNTREDFDLRISNISERLNSGFNRLNGRINSQSDLLDQLNKAVTILGIEQGKRAEQEQQNTVAYGGPVHFDDTVLPKWDRVEVTRCENGYLVTNEDPGNFQIPKLYLFHTYADASIFVRRILEQPR